jgi:hypothetical protein
MLTIRTTPVAAICALLALVHSSPLVDAATYAWLRDIVEKRNDAIDAVKDAWLKYNYWLVVGFDNGSLGIEDVLRVSENLGAAYNLKDNIEYADSRRELHFGSLLEEFPSKKGTPWEAPGHSALKEYYRNISDLASSTTANFEHAISGWLKEARRTRDNISENKIAPASAAVESATNKKIGLADSNTVKDYARAMFLLGKLCGGTAFYIGPAFQGDSYAEFMGREWLIPADMLGSAGALKAQMDEENKVIEDAISNVDTTYPLWNTLITAGSAEKPPYRENWAWRFSVTAYSVSNVADKVLALSSDSVSTTEGYNDNGLDVWNEARARFKEELNKLNKSESAAKRKLGDMAGKLYAAALTYAIGAGWPID